MQLHPGMLGQPGLHVGVLVGGVVVADDVQLPAGVGPGDELEEVQELGVGMPVVAPVSDLAGGDLKGGEQARGAVALVVVGLFRWQSRAQRQDRGGAVQRLDLGLLIHTHHAAFSGGFRYSPTTSRTFASSSGSVENLKVCNRHGCRSHFFQTFTIVTWDRPSSVPSSRLDQCVTPSTTVAFSLIFCGVSS